MDNITTTIIANLSADIATIDHSKAMSHPGGWTEREVQNS